MEVENRYLNLKSVSQIERLIMAAVSIYAAFALYEGGIIDKQQLIRELKTYKLVDQYLFHTFNALKHLHFLEAKEVMP